MNISNIDLNLLVVFKAIFEQRNISKVALNLGLSQPTISHALNRLRQTFDDELFIRSGRIMVSTQKANELGPFISKQLSDLEIGLFTKNSWNPKKSHKKFTLSGTAYDTFSWFPDLTKHFNTHAPNIKLDFKGIVIEKYLERMQFGEVDLSFGANLDTFVNFNIHDLATRKLCLVAKKGSRKYGKKISIEQYLGSEHILYAPTEKPGSVIDDILKGMGHKRNIITTTSYLSSIPLLVFERDCLALLPDIFVEKAIGYFPIKIVEIPFETPTFISQMIWHKSLENSIEHQWLREQILKIY